MEYNKRIADMRSGDEVEGFYILKGAFPKTTAAGKPFLSASLSDTSGVIDAKVWDYTGPIGAADEGKVIKLRGTVSEYRGAPQIVIDRIRLRTEEDRVDLDALVPVAPIDADACMERVNAIVDGMEDADYKAVCRAMLRRHLADFRQIPAAKSVHHGFIHGLLMHTADMLAMADFLAKQYHSVIDRDLLLAGTLLHDFPDILIAVASKRSGLIILIVGVSDDYLHLVFGGCFLQRVQILCQILIVDTAKECLALTAPVLLGIELSERTPGSEHFAQNERSMSKYMPFRQ